MTQHLADKIADELKQIERDIAAQKKVIKRSVGNQSIVDAADSELKALRTRQSILEENKKKLEHAQGAVAR